MAPRPIRGWLALLVLSACAAPDGPGAWQPLTMPALYLAPVALQAESGEDRLCRVARQDIEQRLVRALPGRLKPVRFRAPGTGPSEEAGTLRVAITRCRLESHQWDVGGGEPDITFYQTLGLEAELTSPDGRTILDRHFRTVEAVHTDVPTPIFDFTHHRPAARVLSLFSEGRVRVSPRPGELLTPGAM